MKIKSRRLSACLGALVVVLVAVSPALGASPSQDVPSAPGVAGAVVNNGTLPQQGDAPTGVVLLYFRATPTEEGAILLEWETATEINSVGFDLYRAEATGGTLIRLNEDLIPSQVPPGSSIGAVYTWLDEAVEEGVTYCYWLEVVNVQGGSAEVGEASATLPTASLYRLFLPAVNK